ncbi:hypothetical protein RhiirA1_460735 [Rhizophagus irregularis]|uniref:Uncharacterized protein n=1 Tax=Rhizophagus irregularis TaxID=588596 RepID=A0A2I1E9C1_9GLOM|nr:hypothetical protein RhiirA1_460735 [Rhizophagus irregularis]PKY18727.1 hypothetical protein RhiirB3_431602 [Rhizophagus irregularis]GET63762.1 hypothetical protein GLOIN_2v1843532 [Rhizophagus irregularis DAOM 181602=DAOM 197198]
MWCSYIHDPFRKILKENRIFSKNGYIRMYGKLYESDMLISIEITTLRAVLMEILFQRNMQEEKKFSNLLIEGNL